jgi:ureidoglycolate hydrolase
MISKPFDPQPNYSNFIVSRWQESTIHVNVIEEHPLVRQMFAPIPTIAPHEGPFATGHPPTLQD